jgi:hypothetical protein
MELREPCLEDKYVAIPVELIYRPGAEETVGIQRST